MLLLGALSVLSHRAVLPGFAQEFSTNQSSDFAVPADVTVSSVVASTLPHVSSPAVSSDVTGDGEDNETVAVTAPPPSEVLSTIGESESGTAAVTEEPRESNGTDSAGTDASEEHTESRGVTAPNLTQPPPSTPSPALTEHVTAANASTLAERPLLPGTSSAPTQNKTETPPDSTQPAATTTALHNGQTSAAATDPPVTTARTSTQPTSLATQTGTMPHTSRPEEVRDPSQLEVGGHKDIPDFHSAGASNPLFVMIVAVFTIMVVLVVVAVGFHRYKKRNRRTDFRRLQDLPMDDMMEDTPLALYSY